MGPRGLGPKNHKILKLIENIENHICFFSTWKRCASKFCEGSTDLELQMIDMVICLTNLVFGKSVKSVKIGQHFGSEPGA